MSEDTKKEGMFSQPDPIEVYVKRFLDFVKANQKAIIFAAGVAVLAALVIAGVIYSQKKAEETAQALLGETMAKVEAARRGPEPETRYAEIKPEFRVIIEKYGSTAAGKAALLKYADLSYRTGDYDTAVEMYEEALDAYGKDQAIRDLALNGLAYAYEENEAYDQAARYFNRLVTQGSAAIKAQALFNLGRIYGKKEQPDKQREVYEQLVSEHPDSMYFQLAKEKLAN